MCNVFKTYDNTYLILRVNIPGLLPPGVTGPKVSPTAVAIIGRPIVGIGVITEQKMIFRRYATNFYI